MEKYVADFFFFRVFFEQKPETEREKLSTKFFFSLIFHNDNVHTSFDYNPPNWLNAMIKK